MSDCATTSKKNGFERVVLGLSGGIDSALVALVAADALGPDRVSVVVMPSPNSSDETQSDARTIAANLGVELIEISIAEAMKAYEHALAPSFEGREPDIAEENIQARIRGNLVMALSNKFGWLVLTTGNKSEMSVGYATLYGDMAGGFAVIKDVFKLLVYRLVAWRNAQGDGELFPPRCSNAPRRPSSAPTSSTRTRCRRTSSWTGSSRGTSSATRGSTSWSRPVCRRRRSARSCASSTAPSTSAARHLPGSGSRPRHSGGTGGLPITNRFSSLRPPPR